MTRHLLVTNDYPPKLGDIQSYLWELYRRLPSQDIAVFTSPHEDAASFDRSQRYDVDRHRRFWVTPTSDVRRRVEQLIGEHDASFVMIDPAIPLGLLGPSLSVPYGLFVHGTEATIPARVPVLRSAQRRALVNASTIVSSSQWASADINASLSLKQEHLYLPPGVDHQRFAPVSESDRQAIRRRYGIPVDAPVVLSLSRLVRRKGMDQLIAATSRLRDRHPDLQTLIVGTGRDQARLQDLAQGCNAPVRFLGSVEDSEIAALYAACDVFAMLCRNQWGGLEQEGFGIVFVEAAASGAPVVAGLSGGSAEAVSDGVTGRVVARPDDLDAVEKALDALLSSAPLRAMYGEAGRARAIERFSWDTLAQTYADHLKEVFGD